MPYCNRNDILTKISDSEFIQFLDDNGDGIEDSGLLDIIIGIASNAADAYVASIYETPFTSYIPAMIKDATIIFVCEMLFQRRLVPDEKNQFFAQANLYRTLLTRVGSGQQPLDANIPRKVTPGFGITYESRLSIDTDGNPVSLM